MDALKTALLTFVEATSGGPPAVHNAFYTAIGGRFYYAKAPQDALKPYAVFSFPAASSADTFTEKIDDLLMQISIFSNSATAAEADSAAALAESLFNKQRITVGSYKVLLVRERPPVAIPTGGKGGEPEGWMSSLDFRFFYQR